MHRPNILQKGGERMNNIINWGLEKESQEQKAFLNQENWEWLQQEMDREYFWLATSVYFWSGV